MESPIQFLNNSGLDKGLRPHSSGKFSIFLIRCTVKPVLSDYNWGIAYRLLNTGLTNLMVIQENQNGEIAKYLCQEQLTSNCLYHFLAKRREVKDH